MRRVNAVVTIILAILAVVSWGVGLIRAWQLWNMPVFHTAFPILITACACLGWFLLTWSDIRRDGECRCRKCGHILRGLSEPRCPECGAPI